MLRSNDFYQLNQVLNERKIWFDEQLTEHLTRFKWPENSNISQFKSSFEYSLHQGGKRFRPLISILIGEQFGVSPQIIFPWALAVEMVHTYSLIHDDLPCMDDDDMRRGKPTNHKVFGEDLALLSGDALQSEAFQVLSESFKNQSGKGLELVGILSQAIGIQGMASGQALDLASSKKVLKENELMQIHQLKTAALIQASAEGAGVVCGLNLEKRQQLKLFGNCLGLAFQIKDDLLDNEENKVPDLNFQKALEEVSDKAKMNLYSLNIIEGYLFELVQYNLIRRE